MTTTKATDWRERAMAAEAALAELRRDRAALWDDNQRLRAEAREVEHHQRLVAAMEGSVSWRATKPLRDAKTLAGKVKRRLVAP